MDNTIGSLNAHRSYSWIQQGFPEFLQIGNITPGGKAGFFAGVTDFPSPRVPRARIFFNICLQFKFTIIDIFLGLLGADNDAKLNHHFRLQFISRTMHTATGI